MAGLVPPPPDPASPPPPAAMPAGLARRRVQARGVLWLERLLPAAMPASGVLAVAATAILLGLSDVLPPWPRVLLPIGTGILAVALLVRGLLRLRRPTGRDADRRLEQVGGLRHRPLSTLGDRPAPTDAAGLLLWQAHQARVAAQIGRLRAGLPRPGLARLDPRALRIGVLLALAASVVAAGADAPARLARALTPTPPAAASPAIAPQLQAWVTPPAYTGLAPQFLHEGDGATISVPTGSKLTANLTGGAGEPSLVLDGVAEPFKVLDAASWQAEKELTGGTRLQVRRSGGAIASWSLQVLPDLPPTAAFSDPPGPGQSSGRQAALQTRLPWRVEDDYGVAGLRAELRLRDRADAPAAVPMVLPIPLSGAPKAAHGTLVQELTSHPWAGLSVVAVLVARDAPGQEGRSPEATFTLPERSFNHPVARTVIAIRKQLSLTPERKDEAARALSGLAGAPEAYEGSAGVALNLYAASALLRRGRGADTVEQAQQRLWELALALEENGSDRTARALEAARQAVREAMEQLRQADTPEHRAELERRMAELREAIQRHLEALAEQARRENSELPFDPSAQGLTQRDLDRMTREMQDAAREGRTEDAQRQMAELEQMLEQLRNARPGQSDPRQAERRQRGQQQMGALQDMVQREGGLLDHSQSRAGPMTGSSSSSDPQRRPGPPTSPPSGQPNGAPNSNRTQQSPSPSPDAASRDADQRAQRALRRALGELMQQFGDLAGEVPQPLNEADAAMREAGQALADGRDSAAGEAQQRAIDALQRGGREMSQQMARQFGLQPQQGDGSDGDDGQDDGAGPGGNGRADMQNRDGQPGGPQPREGQGPNRRRADRRDPLGRPLREGVSGSDESGDVRVPDQMEQARTRELQEELRRRGAERTRPQQELDYIDRLLKPF